LELSTEVIELKISEPTVQDNNTESIPIVLGIRLNDHQKDLLILFRENNFQLANEAVSSYAKSRMLFKNQLVESLNDYCYEELDDLLIEETEDGYEINEFYYNKIINLC
jgi:hypothetical protein